MAVHFVLRSHYDNPSEKVARSFDDATVLDWFRNRWESFREHGADSDTAYDHCERLFGVPVYGFSSLLVAIRENEVAVPESGDDLADTLETHLYFEGECLCESHCLQVLTDDDELELAYFLFDDAYLAEHGSRAAFLRRVDWRLPTAVEGNAAFEPEPDIETLPVTPAGAGPGEGTLYIAILAYYDSGNLSDIEEPMRLDGCRLVDLPRYLAGHVPDSDHPYGTPFELRLLRSQLLRTDGLEDDDERAFVESLRSDPDSPTWDVYSDWLQERGRRRAEIEVLERALTACKRFAVGPIVNSKDMSRFGEGDLDSAANEAADLQTIDSEKSEVAIGEHIAQLCLHTDTWGTQDLYHQWILFDDRWAAANPDLANGVLRFANRWDVLTVDED